MVPIAVLGAVFPVHPFDLIYNHGLRHLTGTTSLPRNGAPTRFACSIASIWVAAIALVFTATALSLLERAGFAPLMNLAGGFSAWEETAYPRT